MSKKVFSTRACLESIRGCDYFDKIKAIFDSGNCWTDDCDGKTPEECEPYEVADAWLVDIEDFVPYRPNYTREDTFVINLQLTNIFKRTDGDHEPLDNETIGENIRGLIERLIAENCDEPFDDVKVISVQRFERDLVNSNEG